MQDKNKEMQNEVPRNSGTANNEDTNLHGRVDNTANPTFKQQEEEADISKVDRQEGTMHNGELGGNFDEGERKE